MLFKNFKEVHDALISNNGYWKPLTIYNILNIQNGQLIRTKYHPNDLECIYCIFQYFKENERHIDIYGLWTSDNNFGHNWLLTDKDPIGLEMEYYLSKPKPKERIKLKDLI